MFRLPRNPVLICAPMLTTNEGTLERCSLSQPLQKKKMQLYELILVAAVKAYFKEINHTWQYPESSTRFKVQASIATNQRIGESTFNTTAEESKAKEWWYRCLRSLAATPLWFLESTTQVQVFGETRKGQHGAPCVLTPWAVAVKV